MAWQDWIGLFASLAAAGAAATAVYFAKRTVAEAAAPIDAGGCSP
jgi:hypothetical protein